MKKNEWQQIINVIIDLIEKQKNHITWLNRMVNKENKDISKFAKRILPLEQDYLLHYEMRLKQYKEAQLNSKD